MTITTLSIPRIAQYFSSALLSLPMPKFKHDEEDILNILNYLKAELWKKLEKCPGKKVKCEKLYAEIMDMYERIKKKKENDQATPENITERPFYYFRCTRRSNTQILQGLIYRARAFPSSRQDDEVS